MLKYVFETQEINWETKMVSLVKSTKYKCLICGFQHDYDDTWTDAKKAEVQAEMDAHHTKHLETTCQI
jgi:hypothetical protein